jgi:hypothetical protein
MTRLAKEATHGRPCFLKADADLTFGEVLPTLVAVRGSGAAGVALATREAEPR